MTNVIAEFGGQAATIHLLVNPKLGSVVPNHMKRILCVVLALAGVCVAAEPAKPKVYLDPMNGFENYLAAAFEKKQVPVTIVTVKEKADFEVSGSSEEKKAGVAKMIMFGQIHSDDQASIRVVNLHTSEQIFAYAVDKKNTLHGQQTAAEACAKHLKEYLHKNSF